MPGRVALLNKNGWRIAWRDGATAIIRCKHVGCKSVKTVNITEPEYFPGPCWRDHVSGYGSALIDDYEDVIETLRRQRHLIGATQEEINAWAGLADGHVNKLEAGWRMARFPTLQHWAATLGLQFALTPAPLPRIVATAIAHKAGARP